jgi:DNA polymerase (family 10)
MAQKAIGLGYEYLGISDHTKFLKIENGLSEKQLSQQKKEIDKLNEKYKKKGIKFRILQGAETNILNDVSIDINDQALKKLDFAIAGTHSNFKMPQKKMTDRIIKAIKNPNIDIISHPTGRLLKKREEYQIDFDKILRAAKQFGVALEINSFPLRLDLNDIHIRRCKEEGVKMVINTDSHHKEQMRYMELGVAQARRGWAEKKDIINTQPLKDLLKFFQ